jgi:hypothetical protein
MLIKTVRMETQDDQLFSKSAPLLSAAAELAYHTVNCSALNAEELRRENGIQVSLCLAYVSYGCKYSTTVFVFVFLDYANCFQRQV